MQIVIIFAARNKQTTKFAFLHLKYLDMKNLLLSADERIVLMDALCLRRQFVSKLLATENFDNEPLVFENYRFELRTINSILSKMDFF